MPSGSQYATIHFSCFLTKVNVGQEKKKAKRLFVISGPSGSGKTTLAELVLRDKVVKAAGVLRSVSFTTRSRRSGEREGRDYFFISPVDFRRLRRAKKILEWTQYLGYYYATSKEFVDGAMAAGRPVLLCLDIRGASSIARAYPDETVTVFVMPPSLEALRERLKQRGRETQKAEVRQRLARAKEELKAATSFDYIIVNEDLPVAVAQLKKIVLKKSG